MPGVDVIIRESSPPPSAPTDTGPWFATGLAQRGPVGARLIKSLAEFGELYGERVSYSELYDDVEAYFRVGGSQVHISRVVGPGATVAGVDLAAGVGGSPLRANAVGPGDWYHNIAIAVIGGPDLFTFEVRQGTTVLQRSPELSIADAILWSQDSPYIRFVALAGTGALTAGGAAQALAGGADDRAAITDAEHEAALNRFGKELGPGQVSQPGRTSQTAHRQLFSHAAANNRTVIGDWPDTSDEITLVTAADAVRTAFAAGKEYRFGGLFGPRVTIPGPPSAPGVPREIAYSPVQAALIAVSDRNNPPNEPAAGANGEPPFVLDVKREFDDETRERLNARGINVAVPIYGRVRTYGWRSLALKGSDPNWWQLGAARLKMFIVALGEAIGQNYVLRRFDGKGRNLAKYGGDLSGMMNRLYEADAIYGETPGEAFSVDTGAQVNTPESIADGTARAVITYKPAPNSEDVVLELVSKRITEVI